MLNDWDTWFPNCEPVGHHLRVAFPDRWVRFHSLPGSKRYADNDAERATILERHNRVLGDLVGQGEDVALLTTGYAKTQSPPVRSYPELSDLDPDARPWRTVVYDDDQASDWHIVASTRRWTPGAFDRLVTLVADDKIANVMIVALDGRWLLHPYDGGMDVILRTTEERDALKARHPEWLSARPDGM
ncbi:MAG: hypothetical protein ACHREM_06245 [Polyangiales bacterium]